MIFFFSDTWNFFFDYAFFYLQIYFRLMQFIVKRWNLISFLTIFCQCHLFIVSFFRRSATGEGIFQFRTQRGGEIIRELKAIVELWSARKAVLSIQQASAKHECFKSSSPFKHSRGHSWTFTGNRVFSLFI